MNTEKVNQWLALLANFGVLAGLLLLIYEIRQNTELTRAQIAMERSTSQVEMLSDWANGGEIARIEVLLFEAIEGFPFATDWSDVLSAEDLRRYRYRMILRLEQLKNDWYQCSLGLVPAEVCEREVKERMRRNLHRLYELNLGVDRAPSNFIAEMQDLANALGLPDIDDDGNWVR